MELGSRLWTDLDLSKHHFDVGTKAHLVQSPLSKYNNEVILKFWSGVQYVIQALDALKTTRSFFRRSFVIYHDVLCSEKFHFGASFLQKIEVAYDQARRTHA